MMTWRNPIIARALGAFMMLIPGLHSFSQGPATTPDDHHDAIDTTTLRKLTDQGKTLVYQYPDSALYFLSRASGLAQALNLPERLAEINNWHGVAYYVKGEYDHALPLFTKALHLYEETGDHYGLSTSYNHIGLIYQTQHQYKKAIAYHKKGADHAAAIHNKNRAATNIFNIGLAYDETRKYDSALHYLAIALKLSQEDKAHRLVAMSLNRLGKVNYHLGRYREAETLYNNALNYKDYKSNWETTFSWAGLAEVYDTYKRYDAAIDMGQKSLTLAKQIHAKWDIIQAAEILSRIYTHQKDFEKANEMILLTQAYKDSVYNEEKESKLNYIHLQENELANAKLEKENAIQSAKLQEKNLQVTLAIITSASLLVIILIIYSRQRQKAKLNRQLTETNRNLVEVNETKNRLFSIISHDMRTPFHNLQGLLELMNTNTLEEEEWRRLLDELTGTVRGVSGTMEGLLQWANSQMEGLRSSPQRLEADELVEDAVAFWHASIEKKELQIVHHKQGLTIHFDHDQIETIIRNILGNAIKFTHPSGTITLDSLRVNGRTGIVIRDAGIGMPPEIRNNLFTIQKHNHRRGTSAEKGSGLGLMISHQLLEKNGGYIEVQSEEGQGSTFTIWTSSNG